MRSISRKFFYEYEGEQVIDKQLQHFIEANTHTQASSDLWCKLHNWRITSSKFGEVVHRRASTDPTSILKRLMGYTTMMGLPPAIKWGREKEAVAREVYINKIK
jgi:hypothetical protein